ncbi:MAG: hypothetical protein Q8865_09635 [Bacillota bacterium]|nr:hypothetical protein [Bacillota bacterium]
MSIAKKIARGLGIFFGVFTLVSLILVLSGDKDSMPAAIFCGIISAVLILVSRKPAAERAAIREEKARIKEYRESHVWANLVCGLPLADGTNCTIGFEPDVFIFEGSGTTIRLACDKIINVSVRTDTEVQTDYVPSVGQAIWNYETFGKTGALWLNDTKEITTTTTTRYFIFTYLNDDQIDYICFVITGNIRLANALADMFEQNYGSTNEVTVDL